MGASVGRIGLLVALLVGAGAPARAANPAQSQPPPPPNIPESRTVRFTYAGTIDDLPPHEQIHLWLPIAHDMLEQQVKLVEQHLPAAARCGRDPKFGNHIAFVDAAIPASGSISFSLAYQVTRHRAGPEPAGASNDLLPPAAYLQPDRLVPAGGHTAVLLAGTPLPADRTQRARTLFDVVVDDMTYRKDKPGWGRGDAVWACDSRFGNCADFTSLFLSLSRGERIPAKYEMGFPLPLAIGRGKVDGYHCWAWFLDSADCWTPVDLSHAKQTPSMRSFLFGHLDPDRIAFTIGRDITLAPPQAGLPLNYFIYPYAEIAGQPIAAKNIHCTFTYEDD